MSSTQEMTVDHDVKSAGVKTVVAWICVGVSKGLEAVGVHSWGDAAAMLAAMYTTVMLGEWLWKKFKGLSAAKGD